jgi:hypothetical protein
MCDFSLELYRSRPLEGNLSGSAERLRGDGRRGRHFHASRDRPIPRRSALRKRSAGDCNGLVRGAKGYVINALLSPLWAPEMAEVPVTSAI